MGWVRISDDFYDHPKFADITPLSIALWITSMAYCNRNLTDGYLPTTVAGRLLDFDGLAYEVAGDDLGGVLETDCAPLAVDHLLAAGLWHEQGHDCEDCPQPGRRRYYVHDYLVYQPSAADIEVKRESRAAAGKKGAAARWSGGDGKPHGKSHSKSHGKSHGKTDAIAMAKVCPQPQPQTQEKTPTESSSSGKRATQVPADWAPTDKHAAIAAERGVDMAVEAENFTDWHGAKGNTFKDWDRAFNTWLRRARPQQQQRLTRQQEVDGVYDRAMARARGEQQ